MSALHRYAPDHFGAQGQAGVHGAPAAAEARLSALPIQPAGQRQQKKNGNHSITDCGQPKALDETQKTQPKQMAL